MSTGVSPVACDAGTSKAMPLTPENERALMRDRKKEKKLRYQRHKTRLNNHAAASSPQESTPKSQIVTSPQEPSPPKGPVIPASPVRAASASPLRRRALASPYIQSILSATTKKETPGVKSPERPTSFPKRGITRSLTPQGRKSHLVQQMRAKKKTTPVTNQEGPEKVDVRQQEDSNGMPLEQNQMQDPPARSPIDDEKTSVPGRESIVDSECPLDEDLVVADKAYHNGPDAGVSSESTVVEPDTRPIVPEKQERQNVSSNTDRLSAVALDTKVANKANSVFDMRSIHDYPPEPLKVVDDENVTTAITVSIDATAFNAISEEHTQCMIDINDFPLEEKKEKDFSELHNQHIEPIDNSWDISNPIFEQKFSLKMRATHNDQSHASAFDAFDTSSWEAASVAFSDVDNPIISVKDETTGGGFVPKQVVAQKQTHYDSTMQLIGIRDKNASRSDHTRVPPAHSSPKKRLETPQEHEPMHFASAGFEHFQLDIKEDYPSMDESSLLGIVSKSEDDHSSRYRLVATSHELMAYQVDATPSDKAIPPPKDQLVEVNKESEPLLMGVSSSDDEDRNDDQEYIPIEERVQTYNAPKGRDDDSSVPDDEDEIVKEDEEEADDHDDGPNYIEQESEDERESDEIPSMPFQGITGNEEMTQNVPTFHAAAAAAAMSSEPSEVQDVSNNIANCQGELVASPRLGNPENTTLMFSGLPTPMDAKQQLQCLATLPPPPPPPGEKKKKRKKNTKRDKITPIAPPPEEKLRKWEEEKMQKFDRLMAAKAHVQSVNRGDADDKPKLAILCPSSNPSPSKSPSLQARSPSNMESLADKKTAEKIILASSAAAFSFEQIMHSAPHEERPSETNSPLDVPLNDAVHKNWNDRVFPSLIDKDTFAEEFQSSFSALNKNLQMEEQAVDSQVLFMWLSSEVLGMKDTHILVDYRSNFPLLIRDLLENDQNFNLMCRYMADCVNNATSILGEDASFDGLTVTTTITDDESLATMGTASVSERLKHSVEKSRPFLRPVVLSRDSEHLSPNLLAANFVSFLYLASKLAKIPSPFGNSNPFLVDIVNESLQPGNNPNPARRNVKEQSPQQVVFDNPLGRAEKIVDFAYRVCNKMLQEMKVETIKQEGKSETIKTEKKRSLRIDTCTDFESIEPSEPLTPCAGNTTKGRRFLVPDMNPSPFETAIWNAPRIVPAFLSFLGDPVAVCRMKMVNRYCRRLVSENEHMLMKDAVRVGGLSMNIRPSFWMWIALQKCQLDESSHARSITTPMEFKELEQKGKDGKWNHVIKRDVDRSFGNMPPHKTGARLRTDSIVRALVTWGKNRIMRRGVKGGGEETPLPELGPSKKHKEKPVRSSASPPPWECSLDRTGDNDWNEIPTNVVSDWGGVSPVASMAESSTAGLNDDSYGQHNILPREELALSGNCLTGEMKSNLQSKLSFILNALAAAHDEVGYCQGMDYVVAHLLRILQDTIRWKAVQNHLPPCIVSVSTLPDLSNFRSEPLTKIYEEVDKSLVVEEVIFRVMDTFFMNYNLRHMYWPELRCLKTCCRVFERLIQIKLPVLADHFEHHDLNVGLFALGWFQTLFLYLPSMPSATVCHMWDIWLVERSFKIFFRVGTAILFLSQPILLNHELEGMMTYLNTIPDSTLLKPDILIACALNIKVTNRMLQELEAEVTSTSA